MPLFRAVRDLKSTALQVARDLRELPEAFLRNDPAARSALEVALLYPGVRAVVLHRVAHALWEADSFFVARAVSEFGRQVTGIEIHPGAELGQRVVIDHGMGVVIGETAILEDDVIVYQGVTLGATRNVKGKRHPTLERGAVVGVGAAVLGDIVVGQNARVGAGAVVVKDVAEGTSVAGVPAVVLHANEPSPRRGADGPVAQHRHQAWNSKFPKT